MNCRFCGTLLSHEVVDLDYAPPSNSFLNAGGLNEPEVSYPLKIFVCSSCFLVQIDEYKKSGDIFNSGYVYFSSFSTTWVAHARAYVDMMTGRLKLGENSFVIEIASNDGYLLQHFVTKNVPCLGIEPSTNTARAAKEKGIAVIEDFFGRKLAGTLKKADLILGNNVLAHVPDINDFVGGLKIALKPGGTVTMEFPHVLNLFHLDQFDTIYHEHFSYFSLRTVQRIFAAHGLRIYDVEELFTHGGSLRIFACHDQWEYTAGDNVAKVLRKEKEAGLDQISGYGGFQARVDRIKVDFLDFLLHAKKEGKGVAAYGAAAKGNTLLNFCSVRKDLVGFVADASPHKQGKWLPGSHIPVVSEEEIRKNKPAYVLILPWNLKEEIMAQLAYIRAWGGRFVLVIPKLEIL